MESVTEMKFSNPMFNEMLTKIDMKLLVELVRICKIKKISFSALLEYLIKYNCMQDLLDGVPFKEIALRNDVDGSTVYKYNKEYNADIVSLNS